MYHYVIVRADLPLGVQLAQTTHAAGESSQLVDALPKGTHAVVLHVPNESALNEIEMRLGENNLEFCSIREPDMPWDGQLMAIGIKPQPKDGLLKTILGGLKLAA